MKRLSIACAAVAVCALAGRVALLRAAEKQPLVVVSGPTIIAFFPPVTELELQRDPDTNTALDDFQVYARRVREPLRKAGIKFDELYARSFRIRVGKTVTTFRPAKVEVGYYFIVPGKEPRVEYGVMTDADLLHVADEYFGRSAK